MTANPPLRGRTARIDAHPIKEREPLTQAITAALAHAGAEVIPARTQDDWRDVSIYVLLCALPGACPPLAELPIADYDSAFAESMGRQYAKLRAAAEALQDRESAALVAVTLLPSDPGNYLAQALCDGMERVTAGIGAAYAPTGLRVNGLRFGDGRDALALDAVAETVAMLAGGEASYMTGMTVPVGDPVRRISA